MLKSRSRTARSAKARGPIRIVLADDHAVVRRGLKSLLNRGDGMKVVGEAGDGQQLLRVVERANPTLVILDISMPRINGVEAAQLLKKRHPHLKILMLTVHQNEEYVSQVLQAGADGYLLKNAGAKEILAAVRSVVQGKRVFSEGVSEMIVQGFVQRQERRATAQRHRAALTKREIDVLRLIAQGRTSKQIAVTLFISEGTVNTHRMNLMKKLDIHDKASLTRYALENGLLP
ncbi:MAG TPA: response regulator transcription factor [Bacteroidota bacterium]|nr:response regulator transcription factor [Bacteroidota bacterium]